MSSGMTDAVHAAQNLIAEYHYHIPIDLIQVARDLQLLVMEQDFEDEVSGVLVIQHGRGTIGVNKNHHINRQRFTIAHECGHYLLHRTDTHVFIDSVPVFFRDSTSREGQSRQEIEANTFAAELLMPEENLRAVLREQPIDAFDDAAIRRVAAMFGVSTQALTIRLTRLNLISL